MKEDNETEGWKFRLSGMSEIQNPEQRPEILKEGSEESSVRDAQYFEKVCEYNGIILSDIQRDKMRKYVSLLLDWNSRINLISRNDEKDIWRNHILHSVSVMTQYNFLEGAAYFDLGTGGGLPGIPLAILNPESQFVLCDSVQKKMKAVESITSQLSLPNIETVIARAEACGKEIHLRQHFNGVFARAVAGLRDVLKYSHQLFHPEQEKLLIAWKGGDISEEAGKIGRLKQIDSIQIRPIHLIHESYFEDQQKQLVYVRFR